MRLNAGSRHQSRSHPSAAVVVLHNNHTSFPCRESHQAPARCGTMTSQDSNKSHAACHPAMRQELLRARQYTQRGLLLVYLNNNSQADVTFCQGAGARRKQCAPGRPRQRQAPRPRAAGSGAPARAAPSRLRPRTRAPVLAAARTGSQRSLLLLSATGTATHA